MSNHRPLPTYSHSIQTGLPFQKPLTSKTPCFQGVSSFFGSTMYQQDYRLDVARGNKIDTHFLRLFVRSGQKNISTGILQFCQLTGTYLRVFDHKSLSNVCSQLLCVRGNMSTGWKLSLSNRCRISSFFEMKK